MHSPKLLLEVLALRLELTLCDPHDTERVQAKIDERQDNICKISKVPLADVKALVDSRYPGFVAEQARDGKIIRSNEKLSLPVSAKRLKRRTGPS
jgi:hypothetical protein